MVDPSRRASAHLENVAAGLHEDVKDEKVVGNDDERLQHASETADKEQQEKNTQEQKGSSSSTEEEEVCSNELPHHEDPCLKVNLEGAVAERKMSVVNLEDTCSSSVVEQCHTSPQASQQQEARRLPEVIDVDVLDERTCKFRPSFSLRGPEALHPPLPQKDAKETLRPSEDLEPSMRMDAEDDRLLELSDEEEEDEGAPSKRQQLEQQRWSRTRQVLALTKRRGPSFQRQWPPPAVARQDIIESMRPYSNVSCSPGCATVKSQLKAEAALMTTPGRRQWHGPKTEQTPESVPQPTPGSRYLKRRRGGILKSESVQQCPASSSSALPTACLTGMPKKELLSLASKLEMQLVSGV